MIFENRQDAGRQLAQKLLHYKNIYNAIVIALPRGGVVVGAEIARLLELPLDIICPRKITSSQYPELALGAVTETGDYFLSQDLIAHLAISQEDLLVAIDKAKKEAQHRVEKYRREMLPRHLSGKSVILVDDGLATGSTMKAAVAMLTTQNVHKVILAIPVAPPHTLEQFAQQVNEIICLYAPDNFYAVGQFYRDFAQISDEEVIRILSEKFTEPNGGR